MTKRIFLSLLFFLLISSCAPAAPTTAPVPTTVTSPEIWWSDAVFYEIFVRSFNDSNGDGTGDFNGITQKLGYLQELGITALWLMPIFPSPPITAMTSQTITMSTRNMERWMISKI